MKRIRKSAKELATLKQRWRTALANAGMTEAAWGEREGVTRAHLSAVIKGDRVSARLMERVMAFIAEQEREIAKRLSVETERVPAVA